MATPDGKGGWKVVQDPTYETPGSNKPSTRGTYTPNQLRKEGFVRLNPKAGPKWKDRATRATDGSLWIKRGSTGSTAKPKARATAADLQADLLDLYKPGDVGGWEERYDGNPKGAGKEIAYWVRQRKPDFIAGKKGRKVDWAKLRNVLARIGGRPAAEALSILTRGYINPDGTWK